MTKRSLCSNTSFRPQPILRATDNASIVRVALTHSLCESRPGLLHDGSTARRHDFEKCYHDKKMFWTLRILAYIFLYLTTISTASIISGPRTQLDWWAADICNCYKPAAGTLFCVICIPKSVCSSFTDTSRYQSASMWLAVAEQMSLRTR